MIRILKFKTSHAADPRYIQIFLLSTFLLYGWFFLGWAVRSDVFIAGIAACVAAQAFWSIRIGLAPGSWKSALITALGLCLLLKVNHWGWMALASILAISSKFIIRSGSKHVFNPSNFGIIVLLVLGLGWISPGQWGTGLLIASFITLGAAMVLFGVNRWDVALSFLFTLFLLVSIRSVAYLGWSWDVVFHKFESGTVLIFAFFMITDPRTSPNSRTARIIWGAGAAGLSFLFSQFFYFYQAPILALFTVSLLTPFFDKYFKSNPFRWKLKHLKSEHYEN